MKVDLGLGDTAVILKECRDFGLSDEHTAYVLATAYHETAHTMKPVREAFWLSEPWRKKNLRYWPWYGRGYVQLTWERNYKRAGSELGLDLTTDADVVMGSKVASKIIVKGMAEGWFTGKAMRDYTTFKDMRRVVNGTDKAALIASHADDYLVAIKDVGYVPEPVSSGGCWRQSLKLSWDC